MNVYETKRVLGEYLLFHYGTAKEIAPPAFARSALDFPVRCVSDCVDRSALPPNARALDLGCAVGRATFELARHCREVIGIDSSQRFIEAAETIRREGALPYERVDEGILVTPLIARAPKGIDRQRISFATGDAHHLVLPGVFDLVLLANLIDRLEIPERCLAQLPGLVAPRGQLVITSPYTWLEEFTPREHWLGGFRRENHTHDTLAGLAAALDSEFDLVGTRDLPFLIREHARKFQLGLAQATIWRRR